MLRSALGVGACLLAATGAAALPVDGREILATGDYVPGLGRIGSTWFSLLGFDDSGRALISAATSDGRIGLYWAGSASVTPAWTAGEGDEIADSAEETWARSSPNGRFIVTKQATLR